MEGDPTTAGNHQSAIQRSQYCIPVALRQVGNWLPVYFWRTFGVLPMESRINWYGIGTDPVWVREGLYQLRTGNRYQSTRIRHLRNWPLFCSFGQFANKWRICSHFQLEQAVSRVRLMTTCEHTNKAGHQLVRADGELDFSLIGN